MMKKKKRIIITLTITVIALISICGILQYRYDTLEVTYGSTYGDTLAVIPICSQNGLCMAFFETAQDYQMSILIDTGTDNTYISLSPGDYDIMEKNHLISDSWGIKPPSLSHSAIEGYGLQMPQKYRVGRLPITENRIHVRYDKNRNAFQIGYDGFNKYSNELRDIPIIKYESETNMMGIPVLLGKIVEFSKKDGEMRLHKIVPPDYKRYVELTEDEQKHHIKLDKDHFIINSRYAMPVEVNGHQYNFFIDTGHGLNVSIRLPKSETRHSQHHLNELTLNTSSGKDSATVNYLVDENGKVMIGGKEYNHEIHYTDDNTTKYVINPFGFFDEDFILDFKNQRIWFKE